jgi:hypothetical protein
MHSTERREESSMTYMAEYTDEERDTIRTAAFGAIMLVSKADPGFLAGFKETMVGSKTLAGAPRRASLAGDSHRLEAPSVLCRAG